MFDSKCVIDVMSPDLTNWLKVTCRDMSCHIYVTRSESALIRGGTRCCVDDIDDTTASDCGCRLFRAKTICARMLSWNKCLVWWISCWWKTRRQGRENWRWEPTRCTFEGVLKTCLVMCSGSFVDVFSLGFDWLPGLAVTHQYVVQREGENSIWFPDRNKCYMIDCVALGSWQTIRLRAETVMGNSQSIHGNFSAALSLWEDRFRYSQEIIPLWATAISPRAKWLVWPQLFPCYFFVFPRLFLYHSAVE